MLSNSTRYIKRKQGQALIEYMLLVAFVAVASFAFLKIFVNDIFKTGIESLPGKTQPCVSTGGLGPNGQASDECR